MDYSKRLTARQVITRALILGVLIGSIGVVWFVQGDQHLGIAASVATSLPTTLPEGETVIEGSPSDPNSEFVPTALPEMSLPVESDTAAADIGYINTDEDEVFINDHPEPPTAAQIQHDIALRLQERFTPVEMNDFQHRVATLISEPDAIAVAKNYQPGAAELATAVTAHLGLFGTALAEPAKAYGEPGGPQLVWWVTFSGVIDYTIPSNELHIIVDAVTGQAIAGVSWGVIARE